MCSQDSKCSVNLLVCCELVDNSLCRFFVDDIQLFPFLVFRVLDIAEYEDEGLLFARFERNIQSMGADWRPAGGYRVLCLSGSDHLRVVQSVEHAEEGFTVSVEAGQRFIYRIESVVVSALTVFGFVIDNRILDFNLTNAQVALEVGHIIMGIPQTELGKGEQLNCFLNIASVLNDEAVYFGIMAHRYKSKLVNGDTIALTSDGSVAKTVAALVEIEVTLNRHPARSPEITIVMQVVVAAAIVQRNIVIPVTGKSSHACITVEGVTAGSIRNKTEKLLVTEVVDPWIRCFWGVNYILFTSVVKSSEFH
ncbi:hypothetical protein D3C75_774040 [compost metagenome]